MSGPGRRPIRLAELQRQFGGFEDLPVLKLRRPPLPVATASERRFVLGVLNKTRLNLYRAGNMLPWPNIFGLDDITLTLQELCKARHTAGEASLLIDWGADVNFVPNYSYRTVYHTDRNGIKYTRSDVFLRAVESGDPHMVNVLVESADQENLDKGLRTAVLNRNLEVLEILMAVGANPNGCRQEFQKALASNDQGLIAILSSGTSQSNWDLAVAGMSPTVWQRHSNFVRHYLQPVLYAPESSPSALDRAADSRSVASIAALCSPWDSISPAHLAHALARYCAHPLGLSSKQVDAAELFLAAGADGKEIGKLIVDAARKKQYRLVELLASYSRFGIETTPMALTVTVLTADPRSCSLLLPTVNRTQAVDDTLLFLHTDVVREMTPLETRIAVLKAIIPKRPTEQAMTQALHLAINNFELEIVQCLVKAGAKMDDRNGHPIPIVAKLEYMNQLSMLLTGKPSNDVLAIVTLGSAILGIESSPTDCSHYRSHTRKKMRRALRDAGTRGPAIDRALYYCLRQYDQSPKSHQLVGLLLDAGAKVDRTGSNLKVIFSSCNQIPDLDIRYRIMYMLLTAGVRGPKVTKALIEVLERIPREKRFARLLVSTGKADINLFEGRAVSQVTEHEDTDLLRVMMARKPTAATLSSAFRTAISLSEGGTRLEICRILLKAGDGKGIDLDDALIWLAMSSPCDLELVRLVVSHEVSIDYKSGRALKIAIEKFDIELLNLLCLRPAEHNTMIRALNQALSLEDEDRKLAVITSLLAAVTQLSAHELGGLLADAIGEEDDVRVLSLLVDKGSSVDIPPFKAFMKAFALESILILEVLLRADPSESTKRQVFEAARKASHQ